MILIRTAKFRETRANDIGIVCGKDGRTEADSAVSLGSELHTDKSVGFTAESDDLYFGTRGLSALGAQKLVLLSDSGKGELLGIDFESAALLMTSISEATEMPFIEHGEYRFDREDWSDVLENASLISGSENDERISDIMKWSELVLGKDGMMRVYA